MLSSEHAFEDFLTEAGKSPLRVLLERSAYVPACEFQAVEYQADTDRLLHGMRSGTFLGLKLAVAQCTALSSVERRLVA